MRGMEDVVAPGSVTLFGEIHGTDASPGFIGRIACHAATQANATGVLVGLEISRGDQHDIDAALASTSEDAARTKLVAATHFRDELKDGRDTEAIVALVERVRTLRNAGLAVDIVAFDAEPSAARGPGERDAKMAERLTEAIAARPGATVLVLTGNIHSRTKPGTPWDPSFVPMGVHLAKEVPALRALDIATAGGTAWQCIVQGPPPRFGIVMGSPPDELAERVGKPGIHVQAVSPDSPAARAGLRKGDVILERDGEPTDDLETLRKAIVDAPAGATIELEIWRDGATQRVECDLGDPPPEPSKPPTSTCGEHPLRGHDRGPEPFIEWLGEPDPNGHHGLWYVGPVRASPPAEPAT